jgi:hypothetical protein
MPKRTTCDSFFKKTILWWRYIWVGDTCNVPPRPLTASPCRLSLNQ